VKPVSRVSFVRGDASCIKSWIKLPPSAAAAFAEQWEQEGRRPSSAFAEQWEQEGRRKKVDARRSTTFLLKKVVDLLATFLLPLLRKVDDLLAPTAPQTRSRFLLALARLQGHWDLYRKPS